jgi:hypothetical protein
MVVIDGVAAAAALPQYLPVGEPGVDVFDAGSDLAVHPVDVVADHSAAVVASWGGDRGDAAVAAEDLLMAGEWMRDGCGGDDDVVAIAWPAAASDDHVAPASAGDDLGVDVAAVVADGGDGLVVYRDPVASMMHGWLLLCGAGRRAEASTDTGSWMIGSTVDSLVV